MRAPRSLTFPISPTSLSKYHHPIKKRKDREKKKKKKISLPILSVSISFEASKDICLLGKKGTRKEKKRKGEEDKRTHARRRLRLIYDCFEKNFEKKDRENRVRGGEGGEKGGGGKRKIVRRTTERRVTTTDIAYYDSTHVFFSPPWNWSERLPSLGRRLGSSGFRLFLDASSPWRPLGQAGIYSLTDQTVRSEIKKKKRRPVFR